jgi:inhibitor of cysteine peptidase
MKMIQWKKLLLLMTGMFLAACQPATPADELPVNGYTYGEDAIIDSVEVMLLETFPVQAQVIIMGHFPDGCTTLDEVTVERVEEEFMVTLTTRRQTDVACTQALVPFEETVDLDIEGLEAGTYTVVVQDQQATFTLSVDNVLE